MIQKIEISGQHVDVDEDLQKYVNKKIGRLDLYMSVHARKSAHAEVKLKGSKSKNKKERTCEVILHLPHDTIRVEETTINIYAAVDVVETTLKNRLKKYKELHTSEKFHRRLLARFKRRPTQV